ncbi:MAG: glycoside hydrolase family 3 C-terminal domain-containing protein [Puniceicoccales bacterium]|nr:glycoside hydrolase family 3 C-terminal domain-containing protein [Puniceicoccales bacterium]
MRLKTLALASLLSTASFALAQTAADDAGRNYGGSASESPDALMYSPSYEECLKSGKPVITRQAIYHDGWIDLNKNGKKDVYEDPTADVEARVEDLLRQMNVEEKTVQLATLYGYSRVVKDYLPTPGWKKELWKDGIGNIDEHLNGFYYFKNDKLPGNAYIWPASKHAWAINEVQRFFIEDTRLGIPADMSNEGIRGIEAVKATNFPTQLGLGQTWDRDLIHQVGVITGREAVELGYNNVYAPIMDVGRDQRWGRYEEVYGECPFLVSELGIQMVKGIQAQGVVSTLKHFAIYSDNKGAREGYARCDPQCGPREAEAIHLWPFERVIKNANPLGIMSSYNDYAGEPIQTSHYYLTDVLRDRMGFKGYVVSDSLAVEWPYQKHRTAKDRKDAVLQCIMAGLNIRTNFDHPNNYVLPLRELIKEGAVPMSVVDDRVRDVLRVKFWQGRFDRPYRDIKPADAEVMSEANLAVAKRASYESIVLLKNDNNALPWNWSKVKTIAVCGPNADARDYALGHYGPLDVPVSTVKTALEERAAKHGVKVLYAKGADHLDSKWPDTEIYNEGPTEKEQKMIDEAVANARQADVAVVVVGDMTRGNPGIRGTVGENCSRTGLNLTGHQDALIRAIAATKKPIVIVHISGRPNTINWANRLSPAIIQAFFPGMFGGDAVVDTIFGDYNPGGKLTVTFPKTVGQVKMNFPTLPGAQNEVGGVSVRGLLWGFGHGLSYTDFAFSDLKLDWPGKSSGRKPTVSDTIKVSCVVKNTGDRAGDEVVQLYTRDIVSSVMTYDKNLRGFERVKLQPGESKTVSFELIPEYLELINHDYKRVVEPGKFRVMIGNSSMDIPTPKDKAGKNLPKDPKARGIWLTADFEMVEK